MPAKKKGKEKKDTVLAVKDKHNALGHGLTEVLTKEQKELIKNNFAKNATDDEFAIYINFCEKAGVDPLRGQSHFIKYGNDKYGKPSKPIMMIGIDGFQARATSDPRYEGMAANAVCVNDNFKMNPVDGIIEHSFGVKDRGVIAGAYAILKRKEMPNAVIWVDFKEYDLGRNLWTTKKAVMIVKIAKATLLRREYPDSFSGVYAPEEFGAEITEKGDFVGEVDITPKKSSKQPKVVKPEIQEAEFKDVGEPKPERKAEIEEFDNADSVSTIIPASLIDGIVKPRDALEKIMEYSLKVEKGKLVRPVIIEHYQAWETGEPSLYNIPETKVIKMVESLTGVKMKKKEKSHKCDCGARISEAEFEKQDGYCLKCYTDMEG